VFFYFIFPFYAVKIAALTGKALWHRMAVTGALILLVTLAGYSANQWVEQHPSGISGFLHGLIFYQPLLRMFTFFAGNLCGVWFLKNGPVLERLKPASPWIAAVSVVVVAVVMFLVPVRHAVIINYGTLCPIYFFFVIAVCNLGSRLRAFLSNKVFIFLGDVSYGIYILQVPVQMFFVKFALDTNTLTGFLAYSAGLVLLSSLSYVLLEKPLRKSISARLTPLILRPKLVLKTVSK
jgi:peptidoglycan/LPS O-acetylase OafA/YrhL